MTLVHNLILRGINAIYNQAINVGARGTDKDKLDFANFAYQWGAMLSEHHDTEEKMVFPEIEKITEVPGLMGDSVAEHHAFHDGLTQYMEYLDKVRSGNDTYDGEKLKAIIDSFAPVMQEHLVHEIESLVKLTDHEDKCDWAAWFKKTVDAIVSKDMKDSEFRASLQPSRRWTKELTFAMIDQHVSSDHDPPRQDVRGRRLEQFPACSMAGPLGDAVPVYEYA
ncbi:hypothetical protein NW767_000642 [Fusarium falciforme]|nr:hypothetical protein NW767_000642 [Fusarium falciforme]